MVDMLLHCGRRDYVEQHLLPVLPESDWKFALNLGDNDDETDPHEHYYGVLARRCPSSMIMPIYRMAHDNEWYDVIVNLMTTRPWLCAKDRQGKQGISAELTVQHNLELSVSLWEILGSIDHEDIMDVSFAQVPYCLLARQMMFGDSVEEITLSPADLIDIYVNEPDLSETETKTTIRRLVNWRFVDERDREYPRRRMKKQHWPHLSQLIQAIEETCMWPKCVNRLKADMQLGAHTSPRGISVGVAPASTERGL
jgi:hypothetical protein